METFAPAKPFMAHPTYRKDRDRVLGSLDLEAVDAPIRGVIHDFRALSHCFTLQCCHGHFVHIGQTDPHGLARLPPQGPEQVQYRIAYLALCIEDSVPGHELRRLLEGIPHSAPEFIQFGSPDWFWERQPNSYALQVEPERFKDTDVATIGYREALRVQEVRDLFFNRVAQVLQATSINLGAA